MERRPFTPGRVIYRVLVVLILPVIVHGVAMRLWYEEEAKTYLGQTWFSFYHEADTSEWLWYHVGAIAYLAGCVFVVAAVVFYLFVAGRFIMTGYFRKPPQKVSTEDKD